MASSTEKAGSVTCMKRNEAIVKKKQAVYIKRLCM